LIVVPLVLIGAVVFGFMIVEARRAARHERLQRARGGVEPSGDVYAIMQVAYPGVFLAMLVEGMWRGSTGGPWLALGLALFAAAKALKWWAIVSLGQAWTFRVIVVPGSQAVASGPYRYLRHPNYVAVVGEIVGVAVMADARVTGPLAMLGFGSLLVRRIAVENRALGAILRRD
jgi:methyltransferase